ncbi:MAG: 30S ribosomal protein S1 [Leptospiraceae bacterium]|nr:30S ribosomal protein S1 [Leptospiraceae bacterium]
MTTPTPFDEIQQEQEDFEKILQESITEQFELNKFSKGDIVEATVLDVTDNEVYLDLGQKQEGICQLSEFDERPVIGNVVKVVVIRGGGIEGNSLVSRKEASRREGWEKIQEAYNNQLPLSGKVSIIIDNNKGYLVDFYGLQLFLPKSQVGVKIRNRLPNLKVGDVIDFKVLSIDEKRKSAIISRKKIQEDINQEKWDKFLSKYKEGDVVDGVITKIVSYGIFVRVDDLDGLVHQNDISWKNNFPFKKYYNKGDKVSVKILSINPEENRISLGIKQLTEDPWEWAKRELHAGDIITGTVTDIKDYGAFLEIREGLEGLIHNSEISWSNKQVHPKSVLKKGQEIDVKILSIDPEKKRISLSYKQARENPWQKAKEILKVGEVREGRITGVVQYGAFVEIFDEVEGLIHVKDYSWDEKPNKDMLKKGDVVKFKILAIDVDNRKISCGIKQLELSPYEKLAQKYKKGEILTGKITGISDFGIFVDIGDGFEGLVHKSKIPLKKDEKLEDKYKVGDEVKTVLLKIDPEKEKISLSIKDYEKRKEKEIVKQYLKEDVGSYTLGSILKENLEDE